MRAKCDEIYQRGEHYKAIIVAFCHDRRDIAIELVKKASQAGYIKNTSLAIVLAGDQISSDARSLCSWMANDTSNPYLKALMKYFIDGGWPSVVAMRELPLVYRTALALKHLDDEAVTHFIEEEAALAIQQGDTEGIILTGLAERSMDLLQNWIAKTDDVQTAVLAASISNPKYVEDPRWEMWRSSYFDRMQSWKSFTHRVKFDLHHRRLAMTQSGQQIQQPSPKQLTIRCKHCLQNPARGPVDGQEYHDRADKVSLKSQSTTVKSEQSKIIARAKTPAMSAGTVCPKCGRPLPVCALCMLPLGSPDPFRYVPTASQQSKDPASKMACFCTRCNHGTHAHEAKTWFRTHDICPIADCKCSCTMRR